MIALISILTISFHRKESVKKFVNIWANGDFGSDNSRDKYNPSVLDSTNNRAKRVFVRETNNRG